MKHSTYSVKRFDVPAIHLSPEQLHAIRNAPKHCYLIAMVDERTGVVDDVIVASEFPVEQIGFSIKQKLVAKTQGCGYQQASTLASIRFEIRAWLGTS